MLVFRKVVLRVPAASLTRSNLFSKHGNYSSGGDKSAKGGGLGSWLPSWMASRIPGITGASQESSEQFKEMSLDEFAKTLGRVRKVGALSGYVSGTSQISDPAVQGSLRTFEAIIGAMAAEEKSNLATFSPEARKRVAATVQCTEAQVDDCINKYLWLNEMNTKLMQMKREGKTLPSTPDEVTHLLGPQPSVPAEGQVPMSMMSPTGAPCPFAGQYVSRKLKCPVTRKPFKSCCGAKMS